MVMIGSSMKLVSHEQNWPITITGKKIDYCAEQFVQAARRGNRTLRIFTKIVMDAVTLDNDNREDVEDDPVEVYDTVPTEFDDNSMDEFHGSDEDGDSEGELSDSDDEMVTAKVIDSPGGTHKLWQPIVPKEFMPDLNKTYDTIDEGVKMYERYADKAGFDTRLNTTTRFKDTNEIKIRYVVCSRTGAVPNRSTNTLVDGKEKKRNSTYKRADCKAVIKFKRIGRTQKCKIISFQELHTHPLDTEEDRRHSKRARKLRFTDKKFIVKASTSNMGATKAHKLMTSLEGGYENMGPQVTDYKNFQRKLGNLIADRDAQLVVNKLIDRENELPNFTFEFDVVDSVLTCMFWADDTDKAYYKEFGDVISFDGTFRSNKYGMTFVPFTAIDNHKSNITIGAALLSTETIESYKWLLTSFLKAHKKQPGTVLTDQHASILQAVEEVFPDSRHRWCMWHITDKLPRKVDAEVLQCTNFRKRFHDLVWDEVIEPEDFEPQWNSLMNEYKLGKKRWFKDMYRRRRYWLPAYFKDTPMHGLMKTTSRSESANSFFNKYTNHAHFLVYFMFNFDTAIAKQRHSQRDKEYATKKATYDFKTGSGLERHAAKVYTTTIFLEVRNEMIEAAWRCSIDSMVTENGVQMVTVSHVHSNTQATTTYKVELKLGEMEVNCTCKNYTHMGYLCRHIFRVLMNNRVEEIPDKYVLKRWRNDVISSHLLASRHGCVETQNETFRLISEAYSNMEHCLDLVKDDREALLAFVESTRTKVKEILKTNKKRGRKETDADLLKDHLGIRSLPEQIDIQSPAVVGNRGVGTKTRMVSAKEKAATKKKTRKCKGCNQYAGHNWRSCQVRIARDAAAGSSGV